MNKVVVNGVDCSPGVVAELRSRLAAAESALSSEREAHEKTKLERDEAKDQILALKELHAVEGRIDAKCAGEGVKALALGLAEFVKDLGAENYVEMQLMTPDGKERFTVTVQRVGKVTPHEARLAAESRAERLTEALREIESRTWYFGDPPAPPEWMPMLSLIAWVGKTARAALAEVKP